MLPINATGAYNCLYFGRPLMRPHKEGLVINISSIAGLRAGHLGGEAHIAEMKVVMYARKRLLLALGKSHEGPTTAASRSMIRPRPKAISHSPLHPDGA